MSRHGQGRARRRAFHAYVERLEGRQLLATFQVSTTADGGPGSLRQAILQANSNLGADAIEFNIPSSTAPGVAFPGFDPGTQTWRITLSSALPTITDSVSIDGYTQANSPTSFLYPDDTPAEPTQFMSVPNTVPATLGNNAVIRLIVDGSGTGGATGFLLDTSHSSLRGLIIDGFGVGVSVPDPDNVGNLIQGNFVGRYFLFPVDLTTGDPLEGPGGAVLAGRGNSLQGVRLGSTNATVGGTSPQDNNVIVGNGLQGVSVLVGAEGNQILGNQIGIAGPTLDGLFRIAPNGAEGVLVAASTTHVGGAAPGAGNLISGNLSHGVRITGIAATRNLVEANFIGVGPGGGFRFGAGDPGNGGDGVRIEDSANNRIGGASDIQRNVISANQGAGVRILGVGAVANLVQNNFIGVTAGGTSALGNALEGVSITSSNNVVGPGNVISANLRGILLLGGGATGNRVESNRIGTDAAGVADLGNAREGVRIEGATDNLIIGDGQGSQVISGNNQGIVLIGPSTSRNQVLGNFIGTERTGTLDRGNSLEGVRIENAPGNTIGAPGVSFLNLISANHWGVVMSGPSAIGNVLQNNSVGTDITGLSPLPNEVDGVLVNNTASGNRIGGTSISAGNSIAFNVRDGARIEDASVRNAILTNQIFSNSALGINLVVPSDPPSGVTPNDAGDTDTGPNNLQNAPILTTVATSIAFTNVQGVLVSAPNITFTIQFFSNAALDPSGQGEGQRYLGETTVRTGADGVGTFSADPPATLLPGQSVTATATDPGGNTSEFSAGITEVLGAVQFLVAGFTVDEGGGTATIIVTRSGGSGGAFTVDYATGGGTAQAGVDYTPASGTLSFGLGETTRTFTIPILDDTLGEANETVFLSLSNPVGAAALGTPSAAVLTILDDDQPGALQFSMADYVVDEAAGTATITVVRDSGGGLVTVNFTTADGTAQAGVDYTPTSGTLTFANGQTVATFTIPILLDSPVEADETILLSLRTPTGGASLGSPSSAVLTIRNDTADRDGPRVTALRAISARRGLGSIVIAFSETLDPERARNLLNFGYSVQTLGRDRRLGTSDDLIVGLRSAVYDPVLRTVTLRTDGVIHSNIPFLVIINEATNTPGAGVGLSDLSGNLLDGDGDGRAGGVFRGVATARPRGPRRFQIGHRSGGRGETFGRLGKSRT